METEPITLSRREPDRLKVLHEVQQKYLTQVEAAARLKVSDRQVRRMVLRLRQRGDRSLGLVFGSARYVAESPKSGPASGAAAAISVLST